MPDKPARPDRIDKPVPLSRTAPREIAMGDALRSVYQMAVEEQIPDEMLDLLGKLD